MKTGNYFVLLLSVVAESYMNAQIQPDSIRYDMDKSIPSLMILSEQQKMASVAKVKKTVYLCPVFGNIQPSTVMVQLLWYIHCILHLQSSLKFFSRLFAGLQSFGVRRSSLFAGKRLVYRYILIESLEQIHNARDRIK